MCAPRSMQTSLRCSAVGAHDGSRVTRRRYTQQHDAMRHIAARPRPGTGRAILHVDLDAFFAAVEQLDHPEWRGKPVIVGGDPGKRGVVSTCSYEARVFGVRSAMSSARAAQLCPDAIWAHGSFDRYRRCRPRCARSSPTRRPRVAARLDRRGVPRRDARALHHRAPRGDRASHPRRVAELGITCSVGVSAVKSVAKIASDHDKPDGLTVVCPGDEAAFLAPLPVRAMPGIGPRTAERLDEPRHPHAGRARGARRRRPPSRCSAVTDRVSSPARAGWTSATSTTTSRVKSVSNERTFATDVRSPDEVEGALAALGGEGRPAAAGARGWRAEPSP